jgi:hypothetical protein
LNACGKDATAIGWQACHELQVHRHGHHQENDHLVHSAGHQEDHPAVLKRRACFALNAPARPGVRQVIPERKRKPAPGLSSDYRSLLLR